MQLRLKGPFSATPVSAGGLLYCVNEKGLVQVVDPTKPEGRLSELDLGPGGHRDAVHRRGFVVCARRRTSVAHRPTDVTLTACGLLEVLGIESAQILGKKQSVATNALIVKPYFAAPHSGR